MCYAYVLIIKGCITCAAQSLESLIEHCDNVLMQQEIMSGIIKLVTSRELMQVLVVLYL